MDFHERHELTWWCSIISPFLTCIPPPSCLHSKSLGMARIKALFGPPGKQRLLPEHSCPGGERDNDARLPSSRTPPVHSSRQLHSVRGGEPCQLSDARGEQSRRGGPGNVQRALRLARGLPRPCRKQLQCGPAVVVRLAFFCHLAFFLLSSATLAVTPPPPPPMRRWITNNAVGEVILPPLRASLFFCRLP
jgi:hypothetical protein